MNCLNKNLVLFCLLLLQNTSTYAQWSPLNSGTTEYLNSVYFVSKDIGYVVGNNGIILKSIDAGNTWSAIISPIQVNLKSVIFINPEIGYIVGDTNIVIKTIDGGNKWTLHQLPINTNNINTIYSITDDTLLIGYGRGVLKTTDAGNSWAKCDTNNRKLQGIYDFHFPQKSAGYCVVSAFGNNEVQKTFDEGLTWISLGDTVIQTSNYIPQSCYFINKDIGFVVGVYHGQIQKTINGSANWNTLDVGKINNNSNNNNYSDILFISNNTGYVIGEISWGGIIKTIDQGKNWEIQTINNVTINSSVYLNSICFTDSITGYAVGSNGLILKTDNGGGTVGIKEYDFKKNSNSLYCYPNPFYENTTIEFNLTKDIGTATLKIHNILGEEVRSIDVGTIKGKGTIVVERNGLEAGLYFYFLMVDGKETEKQKIIIIN